jgi:opacity protein-like surface antigen
MRRVSVLFAILALVVGASAATAAANLGFRGIGGHLDYVDPEHIDSALGFGALVDLGTLTPDIGLEGNLDYWSKSYDVLTYGASFRVISIGATGKYYFAVENAAFRPFAGAGVAIHLSKASVDYPAGYYFGAGSADVSKTKLGIDVCGGTLYAVSPKLDLLGELRYRLVSDVNQIVLRAGVVYKLGK